MSINLYTQLPTYADENQKIINCVVDIPKWVSNKYEYDEEHWFIKLDRVLHSQMFYPFDYWFLPQTKAKDWDWVDVVLFVTYPTVPGCLVKARVIWYLKTSDDAWEDNKIIAVPTSKIDPRFDKIKTIDDLPELVKEELFIHFKEIKKLEKSKYDKVKIDWFWTIEDAYKEISFWMENYKKLHN